MSLPLLEWERADLRFVLPDAVEQIIGSGAPAIRVSTTKNDLIIEKHPMDRDQYSQLASNLEVWTSVGYSDTNDNWSIYYHTADRWYVAVIGQDRNDSWNLVTHWGTSDFSKMKRRWRKEVITSSVKD